MLYSTPLWLFCNYLSVTTYLYFSMNGFFKKLSYEEGGRQEFGVQGIKDIKIRALLLFIVFNRKALGALKKGGRGGIETMSKKR